MGRKGKLIAGIMILVMIPFFIAGCAEGKPKELHAEDYILEYPAWNAYNKGLDYEKLEKNLGGTKKVKRFFGEYIDKEKESDGSFQGFPVPENDYEDYTDLERLLVLTDTTAEHPYEDGISRYAITLNPIQKGRITIYKIEDYFNVRFVEYELRRE